MKQEINRRAHRHLNTMIYIRVHSDGDFYDIDYFKKWLEIVNDPQIIQNKNINFMAYTKEIDILEQSQIKLKELNMKIVYSIIDQKTSECDIRKFNDLKKHVNIGSEPKYFMNSYKVYNSENCDVIREIPCENQCFNSSGEKKCKHETCGRCADTFKESDCAHCLKCYSKSCSEDMGTLNLNIRKINYTGNA